MKKLGLLVSVLAVTTLAAPAQAATSKTTSKAPKIVKTTDTFACANGKRATFHHEGYRAGPKASDSWDSWWVTTRETVTNRCGSQWLVIWSRFEANSETNCCTTISVPPGAHFDWKGTSAHPVGGHIGGGLGAGLADTFACQEPYNNFYVTNKTGTLSQAPDCPTND